MGEYRPPRTLLVRASSSRASITWCNALCLTALAAQGQRCPPKCTRGSRGGRRDWLCFTGDNPIMRSLNRHPRPGQPRPGGVITERTSSQLGRRSRGPWSQPQASRFARHLLMIAECGPDCSQSSHRRIQTPPSQVAPRNGSFILRASLQQELLRSPINQDSCLFSRNAGPSTNLLSGRKCSCDMIIVNKGML